MNRMTRAVNTLLGRPVDRPPVCFWHHFGDIGPEATVREHVRFYRESGEDILKMMCDEFFFYPLPESPSAQDLLSLRPLGRKSAYISGQVERAARINEALSGEAFTLYNAFSPYATLKHAMGDAQSMALLRSDEKAALHVLDVIAEDTCLLIEGILTQTGTRGMMLPLQGAERGRFSPEEYARLIAPSDRRVVLRANELSDANLLHLCGWDGVPNQLDLWKDYPGRIVNWAVGVEGLSLAEGRSLFPGRVVMGGFDNREGALLHRGEKEQVRSFTRALLNEAGAEGLIVGADCSLPRDIDPARIRWVIEALEEA